MIFLYHGVVGEHAPRALWSIGQALPLWCVTRHFMWLARTFRIVPISDYIAGPARKRGRRLAAITFDDGTKGTFETVSPLLRREGLPATFFLSTGHLCGGPLLWFSYLNALCFENTYATITVDGRDFPLTTLPERKLARLSLGAMAREFSPPSEFVSRLAQAYPLPPHLVEDYGGMTRAQLASVAKDDLIEIGSHTIAHPFLTSIPPAEQLREIRESKGILATLTARPVRYFAYPGGDYDGGVMTRVQESGYEAAFATRPRNVGSERFEIGRVGIYSPSMVKLGLKAAGVVRLARALGMSAG